MFTTVDNSDLFRTVDSEPCPEGWTVSHCGFEPCIEIGDSDSIHNCGQKPCPVLKTVKTVQNYAQLIGFSNIPKRERHGHI